MCVRYLDPGLEFFLIHRLALVMRFPPSGPCHTLSGVKDDLQYYNRITLFTIATCKPSPLDCFLTTAQCPVQAQITNLCYAMVQYMMKKNGTGVSAGCVSAFPRNTWKLMESYLVLMFLQFSCDCN